MISLAKLFNRIAVHCLLLYLHPIVYAPFLAAAVFFLGPQNSLLGQILASYL